jgi:hypothetical protein
LIRQAAAASSSSGWTVPRGLSADQVESHAAMDVVVGLQEEALARPRFGGGIFGGRRQMPARSAPA